MKRSIPILFVLFLFGIYGALAQRSDEPSTREHEVIIIENLEDAINDATDALREAHSNYDEVIKVFRDSSLRQLRIEVQTIGKEREEMQKELQKLRKDLRNQVKELERLKSSRSVDADSLRRELDRATAALDAAERSLESAFRPFAEQTHRLRGNSFVLDSSFAFPPLTALGKGRRMMVFETDDTLLQREMSAFSMGLGGDTSIGMSYFGRASTEGDNSRALLGYGNDSSSGGRSHRMMVRSFAWKDEAGALEFEASDDEFPILFRSNILYLGRDSIRLEDDGSSQMIIVVDKGESSDGRSQAVIIGMSRGVHSSPAGYHLGENLPNPFASSTTIGFTIATEEHVVLKVFDGSGRLVKTLKDEVMEAGSYTVKCDASDLANGLYLYRLDAGSFSETRTMTVAK